MNKTDGRLKILILEDLKSDVELIKLQMEEQEYDCEFQVANNRSSYQRLVKEYIPHIIIADFSLPNFNGLEALHMLREEDEQTPFIFVTGTLGEENAVRAIKSGATDFIVKNHISQLPAAVMRALREYEEKEQKRKLHQQLEAIGDINNALLKKDDWIIVMENAFKIIGKTISVDRVYYFESRIEESTGKILTSQKVEWTSKGTKPEIDNPELQDFPFETYREFTDPLLQKKPFKAIVSELENEDLKEILMAQEIQSVLIMPIFIDHQFYGFIGFDDCSTSRNWSSDEIRYLQTITQNISEALAKRNVIVELKENQEKLTKAYKEIKIAQKIAKLGYWSHDVVNDRGNWSKEVCDIWEQSHESFMPTFEQVLQTIHPDDLHLFSNPVEESFPDKKIRELEHRIITPKGKVKWIGERVRLHRDKNGKPEWLEGIAQDITDRKKLEIRLEEVSKLARVGGWELQLPEEQLIWTTITQELHEVPPEFQPEKISALEFYEKGACREIIENSLEEAIESGKSFKVESKLITYKGNERWVRVIGKPEFKDDQCVRVIGTMQDIHARKRAEKDRQKILESITDGFYAVDRSWNITYWNKAAAQMLHIEKEEALGKNLWEIFPNNKNQTFYKELHHSMKENLAKAYEDFYPNLKMWFNISIYPIKNGLTVFFQNITEQKAREEEIIATKNLLESIANSTAELIWAFDKDYRLLYANKAYFDWMEHRTGHRFSQGIDFIDDPQLTVLDQGDSPSTWKKYVQQSMNNGDYQQLIVKFDFHKSVEFREISINPIFDKSRSVTGVACFSKNITSHMENLRSIEEQNERLKEIAWTQSHVIRAPVARIMGLINLLGNKEMDDEEQKELLGYIELSAKELDHHIAEMVEKATSSPDNISSNF